MSKNNLSIIEKAVQEVYDDYIKKELPGLQERIYQTCKQHERTYLLGILGFSERWGRLEIDHCNGRSGNSIIGNELKKAVEDLVKQWTEKALAENWEEIQEAESLYKEAFARKLREELREQAKEMAKKEAQRIIEKITGF